MSDLARLTSSRREALERFDASMSQAAPSAAGTVSEPLHKYRGAEAKKSAPRVRPTRTLTAVLDDTEGSPLNQDEDAKGLFTKTAHFSGKVRSSRSASTLREYDPKIFDEGQEQWVARTLKDREEQYMGKTPLNMVVTTWNVGAIKPNFGDIHEWLTDDLLKDADVVVVGLQEVCELKGTDGITTDESIGTAWARKIVEHLNSYGFKRYATPDASPGFKPRMYELVASQQLVGVLLLVFKFTELPAKVTGVHVDKVGVGIMGVLGNKGGAAIRLVVAETSVCFMCTHLSAHHDSSARRNQDFHEILRRMVFNGELEAGESASPVLECDFVFWMGDLNYRVDTTSEPFPHRSHADRLAPLAFLYGCHGRGITWRSQREDTSPATWTARAAPPRPSAPCECTEGSSRRYERAFELIEDGDLASLLEVDQLGKAMRGRCAFVGFVEADISFPPTCDPRQPSHDL